MSINLDDLLQDAEPIATRLKMLIYGKTGTGKSVTSLHFPSPIMIDAERGTEHYGKFFKFKRVFTSDPTEIKMILDALIEDPRGAKTLIIDPFSSVYDTLLQKHESRMKVKTGNAAYTLQPLDYKYIKSEVKNIVAKLLALDMNVIVTARSADEYAPGKFMEVVGTKPEGPKDLPYFFDIVLELSKNEQDGPDKFIATVKKDRTNMLPATFDFSYSSFTTHLGIEGLEREPVVFKQKDRLNLTTNRNTVVEFRGNEINTAGITAENLEKIAALTEKLGEAAVRDKLKEDYSADSILDLKNDEANLFISDLEKI